MLLYDINPCFTIGGNGLETKNSSFMKTIKRDMFIVILTMIAIFVLTVCLIIQTVRRNQNEKLIMQAFDRQQSCAQLISKNASRLYALLLSKKESRSGLSEAEAEDKAAASGMDLMDAKQEFADILAAIHNGSVPGGGQILLMKDYMMTEPEALSRMEVLWTELEKEITALVEGVEIGGDIAAAFLAVDDSTIQLLGLSEALEGELLERGIHHGKGRGYLFFGLYGILVSALILALVHLMKFALLPYGRMFWELSGLGLLQGPQTVKPAAGKAMLPIVSEISEMFYKINNLISLIENINNSSSFVETLNFINSAFSAFIPYNYIGIALIDEEKKTLKASYGVSDGSIIGLPENILGATWNIKDTSLGELIRTGEARIINDLEEYTFGKPMKSYNTAILEAGIKSSITLPLKVAGEPVGVIFFSSNRRNVYDSGHLNFLRSLVNSIAISFKQNIVISDILYSSVLALAKLAEARDEETGEHLIRMKKYSRLIAELLYENKRFPEEINLEFIDGIERFSPLHDIGKVGIGDKILLKPGKLTKDEFNEMKRHTVYGAEVLKTAENNMSKTGKSWFGMGIEIAESHHEKWDGSGYPYGKKEEEIPLSARIVAVADVFDALTSSRPYKEAFSLEITYKFLLEGRGKHFDPEMIDVLMMNKSRLEVLYHYLWVEQRTA
jgi:HD-GYP domain-containing protein (c-di-GMP phosphodiesterase class II)